ncbi:MAG TPA: 50S ribosomal protein L22 [Bacteroidetes bacterium]|nr:MAG: 50S ribosomal protein L22 [Ignavibacteria bacterium GWA2_54_16]HCA80169.1 50S ribosomal protein L22 [Bacteroidota bacterium]
MEAKAINRFIGTSPRKMMIVIDLIRGRGVEDALTMLHFSPKHAAKTAEKVLRSAISNLQSKDEGGRVDTSTMFVKEVFVNGGPMMKRISPAPMGRAFRIRKRSNHLTIVVATREVKAKAKAAAAPKAAEVAAPKPKKKETKAAKQETKKVTKEG